MGGYDTVEKNQCVAFLKLSPAPRNSCVSLKGSVGTWRKMIVAFQRVLTLRPRSKDCESAWGLNMHFENSAE